MTELEKLEMGLEYCYDDPDVEARKENAILQCKKYNAIDDTDYDAQYGALGCMGMAIYSGHKMIAPKKKKEE